MIAELGSFEWYQSIEDMFFKKLIEAMMHCDNDNRMRLIEMFPHMMQANAVADWRIAPKTDLTTVVNIKKEVISPLAPDMDTFTRAGSFNHYLFRSGGFVTALSTAIMYADENNLEVLRTKYPQMIAAFELKNWNSPPEGFAHQYNSERN